MKPSYDFDNLRELLYAVVDEEASPEEREKFYTLLETCKDAECFFENQKSFLELIRSKMDRKPMPEDLMSQIQQKIASFSTELG